ncbi:HK97-gp10 family putative phage morphogenesis protein [Clostridium cochlearium]|uniref:HK97-gp10 family putative phage morphogenesis protein n=1 Tax=Clostridium cochlearium TaxID=1494 RepID=UPI000BBCBCC4|nr:HK97-gp10 family putative phage morphogenesis protein [Clostridium cochlearium]
MADGIEIEGMEEFTDMLQDMTLDEADEKKAMRNAIKPIAEEIEKNTTKRTGKLAKLSKTVKREGLGTVGIIRTKQFYDIFEEFGTSNGKHNIGYFSNSVDNTTDKALEILAKELLDKAK